jgi:flagellar basal-body rod modification protein FlgD
MNISGTSSAGQAQAASGAFGGMKSEDFMRVLTTELANQDPFKPHDSAALLEQLASLRNIESQLSLQQQIESLVLQNQVAMAGGLIGKLVTGLDTANDTIEGIVSSVRIQEGKAVLELDSGKTLPMDRLAKISPAQVA